MPRNLAGRQILYSALSQIGPDIDTAITPYLDAATGIIQRNAGADGMIPLDRLQRVQGAVGDAIQRFFVAEDMRSPFADDGVTALAPYPDTLNRHLAQSQARLILTHQRDMQRQLEGYEDIQRWLSRPTSEGVKRSALVRERSNPLAKYESAHTWVDPNGYRLSDRIWRVSMRTRMQIDAFLADAIRSGMSSTDIAKNLERFLRPSRAAFRTKKPYGRDASFDAMRLARTEIAHAHSEATFAASRGNPFVGGMDWKLSAQHPRYDICDELATIGMSGGRIRDPYPLDEAPQVVNDSHPQCICVNLPAVIETNGAVIDRLRSQMRRGQPAPLTPIAARAFILGMLGITLYRYVSSEV